MKQLLATKLFIPSTRPELVLRPRLVERLNEGLYRKMTLISAPAGFGKTTLASEWIAGCELPVAWLSLDEADNDQSRFLAYIVAALQEINRNIGVEALEMLQSPQPPPNISILTSINNDFAALHERFILVLDDYHVIDSRAVHDALKFLLENAPNQMHLVLSTREDPYLPLSRLRARDQITELRAADLRFTSFETTAFLNRVMGLNLSEADLSALETRTEGWITGLQLAALSLQGHEDPTRLIRSFSGSHRLVVDYLVEEVLEQQPESVQAFLLRTAILDRLSGSLCDAVTGQRNCQETLEFLDQANLFIVPLDNERRWYRYHHLFADLLRKRLHQHTGSLEGEAGFDETDLHARASLWFEDHGMEIEAFHHAAAASDYDRAERLIEGDGLPVSFRGVVTPVLNWLESLPKSVLDARPSLWVTYAVTVLTTGETKGVEEKLQAAEAALKGVEEDDKTRDLIGRIASTRANLAVGPRQAEVIIEQSNRALVYLHPNNLTYRTATTWKLGVAYEFQGNRPAARQAFSEAIATSEASGNLYIQILAMTGLGNIQFAENQLYQAAETYQRVLLLVGDLPIPVGLHVHHSLAQINYEWNHQDAAQQHVNECLKQARPFKDQHDTYSACEVLLARMKIAQGDLAGANALLARVYHAARVNHFEVLLPKVAAAQVLVLIQKEDFAAAAELAEKHAIPLSRARVDLARGEPSEALEILELYLQEAEEKGWQDERLKGIVLMALTRNALGQKDLGLQYLEEALGMAEPGGFIRTFVDEGPRSAQLLYESLSAGVAQNYVQKILAAFPVPDQVNKITSPSAGVHAEWIEPLSERELEVLELIADGLTNQEVGSRLYLSLNTVKVHTRNIYSKLDVNSRTQAVAKAKSLGLLAAS